MPIESRTFNNEIKPGDRFTMTVIAIPDGTEVESFAATVISDGHGNCIEQFFEIEKIERVL